MFFQTEQTPNPLTLEFIPCCVVIRKGTAFYKNESKSLNSLLSWQKIFAINGANSVF